MTMFFSDISDCELVKASQLVEELECTYLSDVELVSAASQNVEDTLKVSGENETLFWLQPIFGSIRYDTRYYFNVRSKADISQLNLPHGTVILLPNKRRCMLAMISLICVLLFRLLTACFSFY